MGLFDKLKEGLKKTRDNIAGRIDSVFNSFTRIDDDFMDELEESLILADLGAEVASDAVEQLRKRIKEKGLKEAEQVREALREILVSMLKPGSEALALESKPSIILVIGVNGVGKTTTIGKLAARLTGEGKKVLLAAGDTFRAAAADQLEIWSKRAGADLVRHGEGADAAAVVYDAINAAKSRGCDVILCDTAGRLQNKTNLMNELAKINRVIDRELPGASRETLLVIDATTGQNALSQAKEFKNVAGITGIALTKLDGTAKGGIVIAISKSVSIPVKLVGVGEGVDDLLTFDADSFTKALF